MSSLTSVGESLVMRRHVVASEWNVRSGMSKLLSATVIEIKISLIIKIELNNCCGNRLQNDIRVEQ